jgi:O-antigen/teichoic acid export membrane protein
MLGGSQRALAALALGDQLIVSALNFATLLLLGRLAGPVEFGDFALVMTVYYLVLVVQESLVTVPYTILGVRLKGASHREYAGAALCQSGAWSACVSLCLALAAVFMFFGRDDAILARAIGMFAIVSPLWLLREFGRRYLFARMQVTVVAAMTIVSGITQLATLCALAYTGKLSAAAALFALGLGNGIAGVGWLWLGRRAFNVRSRRRGHFLRKNWIFGRWLLASQAMPILAGAALLWEMKFWLGAAAIGVYAACDAILRFANPVIIAFTNMITPQVAVALKVGGKAHLRRIVWRGTALIGLLLCAFCLFMVVAGNWLITHSFGSKYEGAWAALVVLSVHQLVAKLALTPGRGLLVLERANMMLWAEVAALISPLVVAPVLIPIYGVVGAVCAQLAGSIAMCSVTIGCYFVAMREDVHDPLFSITQVAASAVAIGGAAE